MSWNFKTTARRRLVAIGLIAIGVIALYQFLIVAATLAKVLGFAGAFDAWAGSIARTTVSIGKMEADVYTSARSGTPVLLVHGVNETGKNSTEVLPVAEALAGYGFRIVVPQFVRLTRQNVTPADVDDVVSVFQSFDGQAGMICASYGCGPALVAASRSEIRDKVLFVVTFGGYFDATETVRALVTGPETPLAYSKWIYMSANSDVLQNENDRQRIRAIGDERAKRHVEEWTLFDEGLGSDARALLSLYESKTSEEFNRWFVKTPLLKERLEGLSPSRHFSGLKARLIIIHMTSDPAIPSSEARRMAEAAKARGIPHSLTLLNIYGHTRPEWPKAGLASLFGYYLPEGWKFMRVLNEVLSYAD